MVVRITKKGYYWLSMHRDAAEVLQDCEKCKEQSAIRKVAESSTITVESGWPFSHYGVNILGPLLTAPGGFKFLAIAVEHSTKWVEAKPLTVINGRHAKRFVWEYVVCRFVFLYKARLLFYLLLIDLHGLKKLELILDTKQTVPVSQAENPFFPLELGVRTDIGTLPVKDASKQERRINPIDADEDITLVNDQDNADMFDVNTLTALASLKSVKPKAKGIVLQEPGESITTTTISSKGLSQDKGKGIMVEPEKSLKKKDQLKLDKEIALKLQAEIDEEERLAKEKDKANVALNEEWDDVQAKIKANYQLAQRLQAHEQEELTDEEKARLFTTDSAEATP
ncbi:hypothetical protein Tco_1077945 [Tanacetum coccineum]